MNVGGPDIAPTPPNVRSAPAKPWHSSNLRLLEVLGEPIRARHRDPRALLGVDDRDLLMLLQLDGSRIARHVEAVHEGPQRMPLIDAIGSETARRESHAPDVEDLAERERAHLVGLDVEDAGRT